MRKKNTCIVMIFVICISLVGCNSSDYNEAIKYEESGDYESALVIYESISDYKDSSDHISFCKEMISAIESFNNAKSYAENKNDELDNAIADAEALIAEENTPLDENYIPALETAISNAKAAKVSINDMPETADEIIAMSENLNSIDYSDVLANLSSAYSDLYTSIRQYNLVYCPTEAYIIQCLQKVDNIIDISAVTEYNDPNGNLNKAGGYTAQVYFSSDLVDQSSVSGDSVIDKGTSCGGSIEVYSCVEDAEKRNNYLAGYDGTIFASGSHTVIGTVLIRTSNNLTASQQKNMESNIITILTTIDD